MVRDIVYPEAQLALRHLEAGRHAPQGARRQPLNDLGWNATIDLETGIRTTYQWFLDQQALDGELRGFAEAQAGVA